MLLIITHMTHIYLHPIYKMPLIQLSRAGSPAHQVMQITDDANKCKDKIIYMIYWWFWWVKKNYQGLIKQQFPFLNDRNQP